MPCTLLGRYGGGKASVSENRRLCRYWISLLPGLRRLNNLEGRILEKEFFKFFEALEVV